MATPIGMDGCGCPLVNSASSINTSSMSCALLTAPTLVPLGGSHCSGSVITKQYRGEEIRVQVLDDGFEWDGGRFGSLSAVARAVTGQRWNGPLFFGLRKRNR